jgi:primosomal protein N'
METIKITCPECNQTMEYWTRDNFINCTRCKAVIPVEPCEEELIEEQPEEEVTEEENE